MSPNDARSLLGQFERRVIALDKTIGKVVVDTNCVLYIHYAKVMSSYHKWDPIKARSAFDDHAAHTCEAIVYAIRACQDLLDACFEYFSQRDIDVTFAFDGIQPIEKIPVLKRRARKIAAARRIVRGILSLPEPTVSDLRKYYSNITASVPPSNSFYDLFAAFVAKRKWDFYHVPSEVDQHGAYACARGQYDALVSNDWDPLLFGCPVVIREVPRRDRLVTYVRLSDVLSGLTINREELCAVCIFSGVDYNYECDDYESPVANHRELLRNKMSGIPLDEARRRVIVDEEVLRWDTCKSVYRISNDAK
jgi:hypothetical protein